MDISDVINIRLASQQLSSTNFAAVKDIVGWMGAMQAQDYYMAKWAIGLRLPLINDSDVDTALSKGEILRTHLLRPTWHLVAAKDIYWMIKLTAANMKAAMRSAHKQLELDERTFAKSNSIIEKALAKGKHLTRGELSTQLQKHKIFINELRLIHLMYYAELSAIVCSGEVNGKNQTYALLEQRVKEKRDLKKEEALFMLAQRYFESRGPATIRDFTWWSGLPAKDAKLAQELIKDNLDSIIIDSKIYFFSEAPTNIKMNRSQLFILPAFDEFIISYKDRSAMLTADDKKEVITNNGIFRPSILLNGKIIGTWKRNMQKKSVVIEPQFFKKVSKSTIASFKREAKKYAGFLEKKAEIKI